MAVLKLLTKIKRNLISLVIIGLANFELTVFYSALFIKESLNYFI